MRRKSSPRRSVDTSLHKGPLNPKESRDRINEMIKHIELVIEKRLAQLEAEEESAIEKCRAEVLEAPMKEIEENIRKRENLTVKETKFHYVNTISKSRIEILKAIENYINEIKKEVKHRIFCRLEVDFETLMKPLLFQGLLLMLEREVSVRVRYSDMHKVKSFFDSAVQFYYKKTNDELKIKIDELYLLETERGRMVLYNKGKTVMVVMDLLEKVDRVGSRILPILLKNILAGKMTMSHVNRQSVQSDTNITSVKMVLPPKQKSPTSAKKSETIDESEFLPKQISFGLGISKSSTFTSVPSASRRSPKRQCSKSKSKKEVSGKSAHDNREVPTTSKTAIQNTDTECGDDDIYRRRRCCKKQPSNLAIVDYEPKEVIPNSNFGRIDFPNSPAAPRKKSFINEGADVDPIESEIISLNSKMADGDSAHGSVQKNVRK
ncbi:uncharacterized protein LOC106674187 isoform X3 [Cimex lectularius]|uniref:Uncharacterized protein n=1 Tax=Cimex lectularius TaxID=79782 RepID=A0A8I6SAT4_CIMLE|nr:uncharacterized protein LOC106674187 isoform X3 [Cimex lectularius]